MATGWNSSSESPRRPTTPRFSEGTAAAHSPTNLPTSTASTQMGAVRILATRAPTPIHPPFILSLSKDTPRSAPGVVNVHIDIQPAA